MVYKRGSRDSSNSKGQVTVFIIIGIVILFTFAGVLFITKTVTKEKFLTEGEPLISRVPQAFAPLQLYTENCLNLIAKQGLLLVGQQGGYTNPAVLGEYSLSQVTESAGINLEPTKVPYWWHNQEPNSANKVTYGSFQPPLTGKDQFSVEKQLERYVEEHLDNCLDNFELLKQRGFDIEVKESKTVDVSIRDEAVGFTLKMEIDAAAAGAKAELDTFFVSLPLQLKHYYEVADLIRKTQQEFHFLEKQGLELLTSYSRKSPTAFAPTSDVSFDLFSALSWSEAQLKGKYQELLISYVPLLRFLGSSNFYFSQFANGGALNQKLLDNMVIPLAGAEDLEVRFDYLGWEPYFKTNSEGDVIRPNSQFINYDILQFGSQQYETHYDISYPALVTITDNAAFNGEGYNFVFALESNIRNNGFAADGPGEEKYLRSLSPLACKKNQRTTELIKTVVVDSFTKEPLEAVRIGFSIPEQAECEMGLTDRSGAMEEKYPAVYGGEINFIKPGYLTNFYPIDTYKKKDTPLLLGYAVAGATAGDRVIELDRRQTVPVTAQKKLFQKCLVPLECKYTSGAAAVVLPYNDITCEEGQRQCFFSQSRTGSGSILQSNPAFRITANNSLSRIQEYYFSNNAVNLDVEEQAIITFERVSGFNDATRQASHVATAAVNGNQPGSVDLFPGRYKVSALVSDQREYVIPRDERCFAYTIISWETQTCANLEEMRLQGQMTGNFRWETPATYFEVKPEDLYTARGLTVYVPVQDWQNVPPVVSARQHQCGSFSCLPGLGCAFEICSDSSVPVPARVIEDLGAASKISEISAEASYRRALEPRWT